MELALTIVAIWTALSVGIVAAITVAARRGHAPRHHRMPVRAPQSIRPRL
jgi:hypothetical protein